MNRRDTIIVGALINAALLAVLFWMAKSTDDDTIVDKTEISYTIEEPSKALVETQESGEFVSLDHVSPDEVDNVLNNYSENAQTSNFESDEKPYIASGLETKAAEAKPEISQEKTIEVTVKKGDSLDKISKAHGTTIEKIRTLNQLKNDRLDIGQVLKVPAGKGVLTKKSEKSDSKTLVASSGSQYYTIKSGDNPWKIARQFQVKYEDILRLNNLNEEKAKNLKVGDKIRVK